MAPKADIGTHGVSGLGISIVSSLRVTVVLFCLTGCVVGAAPIAPGAPGPGKAASPGTVAVGAPEAEEAYAFVSETRSPQPGLNDDPDGRALSTICKQNDEALAHVAERLAKRQLDGHGQLDVSEVTFALRSEGAPYVWPRAWSFEASSYQPADAQARMQTWLNSFSDGGERRCGVGVVKKAQGGLSVAAVAIDALADLSPVPTRVRAGQWVEVDAKMLVQAEEAKLVVLGPRGAPHAVPTSFDGKRVRARFNADHAGPWLVQVLATVQGGPRPVLEALVYADSDPPTSFAVPTAPGESAGLNARDPASAVEGMLNAARISEGVHALRRDSRLDAIAQAHAEAMRAAQRTAHDVGNGDPKVRIERAGLNVLAAGENVAHASEPALAHRALWASPSHRENLLLPIFNAVGIGVAVDADRSVWVCEEFAELN
jgi:uncharacterized protein YkwD